jgi:hypothetical protein
MDGIKKHIGGILQELGRALGGPSQVQAWGPNGEKLTNPDGTPKMNSVPTAARVVRGAGLLLGGAVNGLAASRGPGGLAKAGAAGFQTGTEAEEKQKAYNMEMYRQHATDLAVYQQGRDKEGVTYGKIGEHNAPYIAMMDASPDLEKVGGSLTEAEFRRTVEDLVKSQHINPRNIAVMQDGSAPADKSDPKNPQGYGMQPTFRVWYQPDAKKSLAQTPITVNEETALRTQAAQGESVPVLWAVQNAGLNTASQLAIHSITKDMTDYKVKTDKLPPLPSPSDSDWRPLGQASQEYMKALSKTGGDRNAALSMVAGANSTFGNMLVKYGFGEFGNAAKITDARADEAERRRQIAADPEQAIATDVQRRSMAKDIGAMTYLTPDQKKALSNELTPQMTVAEADKVVDRAAGRDFNAQQAAEAQQAHQDAVDSQNLFRSQMLAAKSDTPMSQQEIEATQDALADGRLILSTTMWRSKEMEPVVAGMLVRYPHYDQTKALSYEKMRIDFTSGKAANTINPINTVLDHLGRMYKAVGSGSVFTATGLTGKVASALDIDSLGGDRAQALQAEVAPISTELAKAYSGGNLTEGEIKLYLTKINPMSTGQTPEKLQKGIREVVNLLHGKQAAYAEQWKNGMPTKADGSPAGSPIEIVSNASRDTIKMVTGKAVDAWGDTINSQSVQAAQQAPKPTQPGQKITKDQAKFYVQAAGGDLDKAKALAQKDQWSF